MLNVMVEGISVRDLFDQQASPHGDSSCLAELVGSEHTTIVSYDVRVCTNRKKAFITDSGAGGLVIVDLKDIDQYDRNKDNWCLLDSKDRNCQEKARPSVQEKARPSVQEKARPSVQEKAHPSVKAEDVVLTIEGRRWLRRKGEPRKVHSDGIALSPDRNYLYYQALTGRTLYRIRTECLIEHRKNSDELFLEVQEVGQTGAADGI